MYQNAKQKLEREMREEPGAGQTLLCADLDLPRYRSMAAQRLAIREEWEIICTVITMFMCSVL
jgi:hypothetical protein